VRASVRRVAPGTALLQALPPIDVAAYVLAALAVILLAARLVGGLFVRLGQPRVVGEMISGILLGPTVLGGTLATSSSTVGTQPPVAGTGLSGALYPPEALAFLNVFGIFVLVLFTFLVGLEVPQQLLRGNLRKVTAVGLAVSAASLGLGFPLAVVLHEPGLWRVTALPDGRPVPLVAHALMIGSGLAATALPVIARILQDKGLVATPIGALGIGAAAVVTPLTFLIIAAGSAAVAGQGMRVSTGLRLAGTVALVVFLLAVVRPALGWLLRRRFRHGEPLDGGLLAVLLVGALLTGMATNVIGIRAFTGGLLFGMVVPQIPGLAAAVAARLQQFLVVFGIPVFLAVSGLQTDLRSLRPEHLGAVALFLAAIVVAKFGVAALVGLCTGLPARQAAAMGALLACGGLVTLVVALAARQIGLITPAMQAVFVIGAIVSTLATGPLLDRFLAVGPPRRAAPR
jgi:Kef-type K+ transport system membrane component KefB